jgi:hypothetical protein
LGLLVSVWSRRALGSESSRDVELKQGHKLVERGPYAPVRHPIYTGQLLMGLGTAIGSGLLVAFAGWRRRAVYWHVSAPVDLEGCIHQDKKRPDVCATRELSSRASLSFPSSSHHSCIGASSLGRDQ